MIGRGPTYVSRDSNWVGFERESRPHLFARTDRTLLRGKLVFVSSDRTGPPSVSEPLTCANNLPLVAAERPQAMTAVTSRVLCQPIRGTYSSLTCGASTPMAALAPRPCR